MAHILVDLSHNERFTQIPSGIFNAEYDFEFLYPGMQFPELRILQEYDLIIIGEIIPAENGKDHLFLDSEINLLKNYVKYGGKLLITTSSGGDQDYKAQDEDIEDYKSFRALSPISGVKRYWWGEVLHPTEHVEYMGPEDIVFTRFPNHPIFHGIKKILFSDTTFLEPSTVHTAEVVLTTRPGTIFRYFVDDSEEIIDEVPLITYRKFGSGSCLVIGTTLFMSTHEHFGSSQFDNAKFFHNIIEWLINEKQYK